MNMGKELEDVEKLMKEVAQQNGSTYICDMVNEHLSTGGKRIRARLAISLGQILNAPYSNAVLWASACEILHNATLVHDDLQDGDRFRRGKPTVWNLHGMAQAINAGDFMFMSPFYFVQNLDTDLSIKQDLSFALSKYTTRIICGQSNEPFLIEKLGNEPVWKDYIETISNKTAALFELVVLGSCRLANRNLEESVQIADSFRPLGLLFQVVDDILDLYGKKGRDSVGSDIKEGKVSALCVKFIECNTPEKEWFINLLKKPRENTSDSEVQKSIDLIKESGALKDSILFVKEQFNKLSESKVLNQESGIQELALSLANLNLDPIHHVVKEMSNVSN